MMPRSCFSLGAHSATIKQLQPLYSPQYSSLPVALKLAADNLCLHPDSTAEGLGLVLP